MKIKVTKVDGSSFYVYLLRNKNENTYSFVNLSRGHICPCKFSSIEEALVDILTYKNNKSYDVETIDF